MMLTPARAAKISRYLPLVAGGKRQAPISIQVALTDSCYNRCIGCGHPQRVQKKMTPAQWLGFLESLPVLPESVCYSGGDPMAYHDFNTIMEWHIMKGIAFGCTVTGYIPNFIDLSLLAKAAWVRVSLDAVDEEVYAVVRGRTPLHKVIAGIDAMLAAGVNVAFGVTLHPANEGQLPKIQAFAKERGITDVESRYAYPQSNPMWEDVDLETRQVMPFESCKAALYQMYIDSDGSVYPCCITAGDTRNAPQAPNLGNIYDDAQSWAQIWQNVVNYSNRHVSELPDICRNCCVKRLSEINHVAGSTKLAPSFF